MIYQPQNLAALEVHGTCGQTVEMTIGGVTVSFTCSPPDQTEPTPGPIFDPGSFGGGHIALAIERDVFDRLATSDDLVVGAEPYVVRIDPGASVDLGEMASSIDEARDAGKTIRLEIRDE